MHAGPIEAVLMQSPRWEPATGIRKSDGRKESTDRAIESRARLSPWRFERRRLENRQTYNADNEKTKSLTSFLDVGFRRAASAGGFVTPDRLGRVGCITVDATAKGWAAGIAGSLNLLRRPQIRLGELDTFFGTGNLALMSFR